MTHEPIVGASVRPKGERRRSPLPMLLMILAVLAVLVVVPFMLLRPRTEVFTVRTFETALVETGTIMEYVRSAGTLVPRIERAVLAPGAGVLVEWLVTEGDEVLAGDLLGRLESPDLLQAVASREAALAQAERRVAELTLQHGSAARDEAAAITRFERDLAAAREDAAMTRDLWELGAAARVDLTTAEAAVTLAEQALAAARTDHADTAAARQLAREGAAADLEQAQAAALLAREQAGATELRAPIAGRIIQLNVSEGENVSASANLAILASTSDLRVAASVGEAQVARLGVGQPALLRVAGTDYPGAVVQVGQQAQASSDQGTTVSVTLEFDDPPAGLRLGASVAVEIEVGRRDDALYLPRGAYLTTGGERMAYVVGDGEAQRATVIYGLIDGNRVEVLDGLEPGQRIITSSYEAYREHATVRLAPEGEIR